MCLCDEKYVKVSIKFPVSNVSDNLNFLWWILVKKYCPSDDGFYYLTIQLEPVILFFYCLLYFSTKMILYEKLLFLILHEIIFMKAWNLLSIEFDYKYKKNIKLVESLKSATETGKC